MSSNWTDRENLDIAQEVNRKMRELLPQYLGKEGIDVSDSVIDAILDDERLGEAVSDYINANRNNGEELQVKKIAIRDADKDAFRGALEDELDTTLDAFFNGPANGPFDTLIDLLISEAIDGAIQAVAASKQAALKR